MQIASWNVNSLRSRLDHVVTWLTEAGGQEVDLLCLQETKVMDPDFPHEPLQAQGWHTACFGQKSYNGVALIARQPLPEVIKGFEPVLGPAGQTWDAQARAIATVLNQRLILNVYVPNGSEVGSEKYEYKLAWLGALRDYLTIMLQTYPEIVVCGDFNVAPDDRDIYDPKGKETHIMASAAERVALAEITVLGFQDGLRMGSDAGGQFSWWDYRAAGFARNRGWRIDHHYLSQALQPQLATCTIDPEPRGWTKPSDHTPVLLTLRD